MIFCVHNPGEPVAAARDPGADNVGIETGWHGLGDGGLRNPAAIWLVAKDNPIACYWLSGQLNRSLKATALIIRLAIGDFGAREGLRLGGCWC